MTIPARVHFCWIGPTLPWAYVFAVLSAAARGQMDEIILHHTDVLDDGPALNALRRAPGVRLEHVDPQACLAAVEARLALGGRLTALYAGLTSPVQRADVLRAAILYLQGGIYLDLDTITVASLRPLLAAPQFVGTEFIVWPLWVRSSRSPLVWARHLALDVLRKALRLVPGGWRGFRHVEHWYFKGVNNAVMGAAPEAPLFAAYLQAMTALPAERQTVPYALGPDLLQTLVGQFSGRELTIHEPAVFYPLPPEISEHWFRPSRQVQLDLVLRPQTLIVHWYASVRSKRHIALIDPDYIRAHGRDQLYSTLVASALPQL
jgi:Glycosyltransferase sugar-binding region containing DXD motif